MLIAYKPFVTPLPVWDYWPWLLVPLCIGVSIVYKAIKCGSMKTVPREAAQIFGWIILAMAGAALALMAILETLER